MDEEKTRYWKVISPGLDLYDYGDGDVGLKIDDSSEYIISTDELDALATHAPAVKALVDAAQEVVSWELKDTHGFKELRAALEPFNQGQDDGEAELAAAEGAAQAEQEEAAWEAYQAEQERAAAEQYAAYEEPPPDDEPPF